MESLRFAVMLRSLINWSSIPVVIRDQSVPLMRVDRKAWLKD
jgi:hypothetical protein